ncbi:ferric-chelate reductase Frp1 [Neonectria punicea]|uniref:ferric-chelate reductase (NADPH) n=1 Tax=Neonectria punicea TaxID=979145 RepID=A0ABR1GWV1_9HYPO
MDMDHMHHDPGLGMDTNYAFARRYWYTIAGVVGSLAVVHGINQYDARQRLKACHNPSIEHPTRPQSPLSQAWATATAIVREIGHPQYYVPFNGFRWTTPPPLGRIVVLACYWAAIVYLMRWNAVQHDVYYYERIGYRNAWVSLCQLPLLYLLAMKVNVVGFLIGTGHERLNWLHRWIARTMFVTATVHGFHFWTLWVKADFVAFELQIMPLVKYGIGAWGTLLWNVVVGLVPIRRLAYEVWVVQHVLSSIIMLWLLHKHIPSNARYLLWMSVSFLVFDRAARWLILLWQNTRLLTNGSACQGMKRVGHRLTARAVCPSTTVVTIKDVHFEWKAGQHIYLWVPRLGPLEAHPYTIACAHRLEGTCCCNSIQLVVRAQAGFSRRLHEYATKNPTSELTGFVSGPYGAPPRWDVYETMVLIGASTGASFTVPILECIANATTENCLRRVEVVLMARTAEEINYYVERTEEASRIARDKGVTVRVHVAITGASKGEQTPPPVSLAKSGQSNSDNSIEPVEEKSGGCCCSANANVSTPPPDGEKTITSSSRSSDAPELVREYTTRPDIDALIREPVEQAWGETAVVVCGGPELVARTRNCVSRLSDERAVHKGTGAQGIYLHVEEYSF